MSIPYTKLREKWKKEPDFRNEHTALQPEFKLARDLIKARLKAGLSQNDVAARMGTSQPAVAPLERGRKASPRAPGGDAEAAGGEGG
ncbi:MAG: helix-turn-helix transcriptional regulator, partial [Halieaceae bacterium]|nr:helix-turn-helix transcriptional regulator [Halieaceae bacterium]